MDSTQFLGQLVSLKKYLQFQLNCNITIQNDLFYTSTGTVIQEVIYFRG